MKTNFIFLAFFIFPCSLLAEYNGHQLEFKIIMHSGKELMGYQYLPQVFKEDENQSYEEFLEEHVEVVLRNDFSDGLGEHAYFNKRIVYSYLGYGSDSNEIMVLVDKRSILIDSVQSLEILSMISQTYMIGVSSLHDWSDRHWMKSPPHEKITTGGYLCDHQVFVHEDHSRTANIKQALDSLMLDFEKQIKEQEEIMRFSDGEDYYNAQEKISELEYALDEKVYMILEKFEGMKVVIVSGCTC